MKTLAAALSVLSTLGTDTLDVTGFDVLAGIRQQFDAGHGIDSQAASWAKRAERYGGYKGPKAARRAAAMQTVADALAGVLDEPEAAPAPRTFAAFVCESGELPVPLAFEDSRDSAFAEAGRVLAEGSATIDPALVQVVEVELYEDRGDATAAGIDRDRWVLFGAAFCPPGYDLCARVAG